MCFCTNHLTDTAGMTTNYYFLIVRVCDNRVVDCLSISIDDGVTVLAISCFKKRLNKCRLSISLWCLTYKRTTWLSGAYFVAVTIILNITITPVGDLGVASEEIFEVFSVATTVGGFICIPQTRRDWNSG